MHKIFRWKIFSLLQIEVTMTLKLKNIYILFTFVPLSLRMSLRMTSASYNNSIYRLACSVLVHSLTTFWWGLTHFDQIASISQLGYDWILINFDKVKSYIHGFIEILTYLNFNFLINTQKILHSCLSSWGWASFW